MSESKVDGRVSTLKLHYLIATHDGVRYLTESHDTDATEVQTTLGSNFVAANIQGYIAVGGWDEHSYVDFLVVTEAVINSLVQSS